MSKETVLPKNIRQIGEIRGREKICLEDYVVTYIRKKEQQEEAGYLGIFLGEQQETEDSVYVFIRGILEVPQEEQEGENPQEKLMEALQKDRKNYFPDWEVQGCCVIGAYPAARMERLTEIIPEAGNVLYHLQEQEETLYDMTDGQYARLRGYFVFYEQNRKMQEYLADSFPEDNVEKESRPDQAIKSFREKVKEKGFQKHSSMLKLASSFFVIAVLVVGAVAVNRVEDIRAVRNLTGEDTPENESLQEQKLVNGALMADSAAGTSVAGTSGDGADTGTAGTADEAGLPVSAGGTDSSSADSSADTLLMGSDAFWEETFEDEQTVAADGSAQAGASGDGSAVSGSASGASGDGSAVSGSASGASGDASAVSAGVSAATGSASGASSDASAASGSVTGVSGDASAAADSASGASGDGLAATGSTSGASGDASAVSDSVTGVSGDASAATGSVNGTSGDASAASGGTSGASASAASGGISGNVSDASAAGTTSQSGQSAQEAASRQTQAAYIIKEGDTLADICSKYYGTLDRLAEICEANEIADANLIMPGQKIVLP